MIYLASPYSGTVEEREKRYNRALEAVVHMTQLGYVVFSPIVYGHQINQIADLPHTWEFWERWDRQFIEAADQVMVLKLPGWEDSVGVKAEIDIALELGKAVTYFDPEYLEEALELL